MLAAGSKACSPGIIVCGKIIVQPPKLTSLAVPQDAAVMPFGLCIPRDIVYK